MTGFGTKKRERGILVLGCCQNERERGILALVVLMAPQIGDDISVEVVAWRWSMLSWLDIWSVIELCLVILAVGFCIGYGAAKYVAERARPIPCVPLRCEYCVDKVNLKIFPYKRCSGCGASPSYHHGRCCPVKNYIAQRAANERCEISWRSIGTQSQCTYQRKLEKPRFTVLPEVSGGVFDISSPG